MSEPMSDKCPKCGAEFDTRTYWNWRGCQQQGYVDEPKTMFFMCGRAGRHPEDTVGCLRRQLADARAEVDQLKAENAELRAAYRLDGAPWFRKNCRRQRCVGAKICQECPFRAGIEAAEAARERSEG